MVCISPIKDRCIFLFAGIILQRNVLARNMRRYACRVRILAIAFDQVKIQERTWPKIKFGPAQSQMRHITSTFGPLLCHLVIPIGPKNPGYILNIQKFTQVWLPGHPNRLEEVFVALFLLKTETGRTVFLNFGSEWLLWGAHWCTLSDIEPCSLICLLQCGLSPTKTTNLIRGDYTWDYSRAHPNHYSWSRGHSHICAPKTHLFDAANRYGHPYFQQDKTFTACLTTDGVSDDSFIVRKCDDKAPLVSLLIFPESATFFLRSDDAYFKGPYVFLSTARILKLTLVGTVTTMIHVLIALSVLLALASMGSVQAANEPWVRNDTGWPSSKQSDLTHNTSLSTWLPFQRLTDRLQPSLFHSVPQWPNCGSKINMAMRGTLSLATTITYVKFYRRTYLLCYADLHRKSKLLTDPAHPVFNPIVGRSVEYCILS